MLRNTSRGQTRAGKGREAQREKKADERWTGCGEVEGVNREDRSPKCTDPKSEGME